MVVASKDWMALLEWIIPKMLHSRTYHGLTAKRSPKSVQAINTDDEFNK